MMCVFPLFLSVHAGTASTDTVCGDCVGDTYSDGSFTSCRQHTQYVHSLGMFSKDYTLSYLLVYLKCNYLCDLCRCEFIGLVLRKGSSSYDTDCFQRQSTVAILAGIIAGVAVLAAMCVGFIYIARKRNRKAQNSR